jgi:pimeloyl-ACP methyl ester carboxylesterase
MASSSGHGTHDPRPAAGAQELAALLPHATFELIEAGHLPWLERPDVVGGILAGFLRSSA